MSFLNKYGNSQPWSVNATEAQSLLANARPMTYARVKDGETDFLAVREIEKRGAFIRGESAKYRAFALDPTSYGNAEGKKIRGTREKVPASLMELFPEVGSERFFIAEVGRLPFPLLSSAFEAEPGVKWLCEYRGDNDIHRWLVPSVTDLSTKGLVALLEHRMALGAIDIACGIGQWMMDEAVRELVRRSLADLNHPGNQATAWLAMNFDKKSLTQVEWLRIIVNSDEGIDQLRRRHPLSQAVQFTDKEPITGNISEWIYLPAIPGKRKAVIPSYSGDVFFLPDGTHITAEKAPDGSCFRVRPDGRTDLFLQRGSRDLGNKGWMWVVVNNQAATWPEVVEAAIDPLDNYVALRQAYTPICERIRKTLAEARGSVTEV